MKFFTAILLTFLFTYNLFAIDSKSLKAVKTLQAIKIDGDLSEDAWQNASVASDFTQNAPNTGKPSQFQSEVKILYDNTGVYIGAMLYDTHPDSILKELGTRDAGENNSDLFQVAFDTYFDKQNAFSFMVSAAGTQTDARHFTNNSGSDEGQDLNWSAAWSSTVKIKNNGWVVEMKIPFSAIRFADKPEQVWGINFMRVVRRHREKSYWNEINPSVNGFVNQFGKMEGLQDVKPPLRLMFFPYLSSYLIHDGASNQISPVLRGGADVKYGINESFTLDMTLVPDFGQVQSDNIVYNLSPYEVRFNEYRQFFTEGTELFNKGDMFYSRRVGGRPLHFSDVAANLGKGETILKNPNATQLINATKISGRTPKKLGIGFFNALTNKTNAIIADSTGKTREEETTPLTNYNMLVIDQPFMKNSYVSFVNTNVTRFGGDADANVSMLMAKIADNKNTFAFNGDIRLSQNYGTSAKNLLGHSYNLAFGKYSGKYLFELNHKEVSNTYEQNDLGYLSNNNEISTGLYLTAQHFGAGKKIIRRRHVLNIDYGQYYANRAFSSLQLTVNNFILTNSFFAAGLNGEFYPVGAHDYYATRVFGRYISLPSGGWLNGWISTDYRKKFALDLNAGYFKSFEIANDDFWFGVSPRYRVNNHLSIIYNLDTDFPRKEIGWATVDKEGEPIFGKRDVSTLTNILTTTYTFTPRMSLSFRLRHYSLFTKYEEYYRLDEQGKWYNYPQNESHDLSFNAFNIDCVYSWEFRTGSFLSVVWKNAISDYQGIYIPSYYNNLRRTFDSPQTNSLSVKVVYFLDSQVFKKRI